MIKPVGQVKKEYKYPKPSNPPTQAELDVMSLRDAIPYLRSLPKNDDEQFPWPLVELYLKNYHGKTIDSDLPEPQEGYEWIWVSSMAKLSGIGGWLEVNPTLKKQARFKFVCMS